MNAKDPAHTALQRTPVQLVQSTIVICTSKSAPPYQPSFFTPMKSCLDGPEPQLPISSCGSLSPPIERLVSLKSSISDAAPAFIISMRSA